MKFHHSTPIDPSAYEVDGLVCEGYNLRVSNYTHLADLGAIRAQQDWTAHVAPTQYFKGTLGDTYDFISLSIPECLPDRIELVAYANEMYFLHDDVVEDSDQREVGRVSFFLGYFLPGFCCLFLKGGMPLMAGEKNQGDKLNDAL